MTPQFQQRYWFCSSTRGKYTYWLYPDICANRKTKKVNWKIKQIKVDLGIQGRRRQHVNTAWNSCPESQQKENTTKNRRPVQITEERCDMNRSMWPTLTKNIVRMEVLSFTLDVEPSPDQGLRPWKLLKRGKKKQETKSAQSSWKKSVETCIACARHLVFLWTPISHCFRSSTYIWWIVTPSLLQLVAICSSWFPLENNRTKERPRHSSFSHYFIYSPQDQIANQRLWW